MEADVGNGSTNDQQIHTGVSDGTDHVFSVFFFTFSVIHEFFGVFEEDSALGIALLGVQGTSVNGHFGFGHLSNAAFGFTADDHSLQNVRLENVGAHDLADTDVFRVEKLGVFGQSLDAELGQLLGEVVSVTHQFRSQRSVQHSGNLL